MAKKVVISLFLLLFFSGALGASYQKSIEYSQFNFQHYQEASKKGHWWRVKETTDPFTNERNFLLSLPCNRSVEADPYDMEKIAPRGILHIRYEDGEVDLFLYVSTMFHYTGTDVTQGDVRVRLDEGAIQDQKWNMFVDSAASAIDLNLWFFPKESHSLENFVGQLLKHEKMAIEIKASSPIVSLNESCGFNLNGLNEVLQPYLDQIGWRHLKDHSASDDLENINSHILEGKYELESFYVEYQDGSTNADDDYLPGGTMRTTADSDNTGEMDQDIHTKSYTIHVVNDFTIISDNVLRLSNWNKSNDLSYTFDGVYLKTTGNHVKGDLEAKKSVKEVSVWKKISGGQDPGTSPDPEQDSDSEQEPYENDGDNGSSSSGCFVKTLKSGK